PPTGRGGSTPTRSATPPGSQWAACLPSAIASRCASSSIRTCSTTTSCGRQQARPTATSPSPPPSSSGSPAAASAIWQNAAEAIAKAPPGDEEHGLHDDVRRHLRCAAYAVDELDRHLDDPTAELRHSMRHLDLEPIALGPHGVGVDPAKQIAAVGPE